MDPLKEITDWYLAMGVPSREIAENILEGMNSEEYMAICQRMIQAFKQKLGEDFALLANDVIAEKATQMIIGSGGLE